MFSYRTPACIWAGLLLAGSAGLSQDAPAPARGDAEPAAKRPTGRVFIVDPATGSAQGDGSAGRPWRTVEEVLKAGLIQTKDAGGKPINPSGPVRAGDTLLLKSGNHGAIDIHGAYNDEFVTIAGAEGSEAQVSRVDVHDAKKWIVRGLAISPTFAKEPYTGSMASMGERGPGSDLVLEDCFLFTAVDSSKWTKDDWIKKACCGIWLGRHGTNLVARNNHVLNTRFAVNLCSPDSLCEGNLIANFSGDGIRVTRDGITVQHCVIKNAYVSGEEGDQNHDDAIQCFLFNKGTGTVRRVTIRGNLIISREDPNQPFPNHFQSIGFFDGPLIDFVVEKNVVLASHWHGISLYDAQNCVIQDNAVNTKWTDNRMRPWIMLGGKQGLAKGNTVRNNMACSFDLKADPGAISENNRPVTDAEFNVKFQELQAFIESKFGRYHPVSRFARVGTERVEKLPPRQTAAVNGNGKKNGDKPAEAAAPDPKPEPKPIAEEALAPWKKRLLDCVAAATKAGRRPYASLRLFGKQPERVQVTGCTESEITVLVQGSAATVAWDKLGRADRTSIARALADEANASDLALVAVWARAAGDCELAADCIAKAQAASGGKDAAVVADAMAIVSAK